MILTEDGQQLDIADPYPSEAYIEPRHRARHPFRHCQHSPDVLYVRLETFHVVVARYRILKAIRKANLTLGFCAIEGVTESRDEEE